MQHASILVAGIKEHLWIAVLFGILVSLSCFAYAPSAFADGDESALGASSEIARGGASLQAQAQASSSKAAWYSAELAVSGRHYSNAYVGSISLSKGKLVVWGSFNKQKGTNSDSRKLLKYRRYVFKFAKKCKYVQYGYYWSANMNATRGDGNRYLTRKAFIEECKSGNYDSLGLTIRTNKVGKVVEIGTRP